MPLTFTGAPSSRIRKAQKPKHPFTALGIRAPIQRTNTLSPSKSEQGRKPARQRAKSFEDADDVYMDHLEDHGLIASLGTDLGLSDVAQIVRYVHEHAFDDIPARSGFNSTRTSETLNFRRSLPPVVSVPHILALCPSSTAAEREIAQLTRAGVLRRVRIPGRGQGGSAAIGEGVVLCESWYSLVNSSSALHDHVKATYIATLKRIPEALSVQAQTFTPYELSKLSQAGFLTTSSASQGASTNTTSFASPDTTSLGTLTSLATVGSRAASGSIDAVGGANAVHSVGGGGGALSASERKDRGPSTELLFSVPSMGPYLRLLQNSRDHLVRLLSQSKFREAPMDWLKEKWDGAAAVSGSKAAHERKTSGLSAPLLPAKTRKWKQFYGLRFEWVLEECLGTGLIEVFETGSVGLGVRLV